MSDMINSFSDQPLCTCNSVTTLYQQGESHDTVYWIEQGFVTLHISDAEGRSSITDLLGQGDFFGPGLLAFPSDSDRRLQAYESPHHRCLADHSATAKAETHLRRLPASTFWQLANNIPAIHQSLSAQLILVQRRLQQQLFLQQTGTLEQRLAHVLYSLFDRLGLECTHDHLVDIRFSQQELADMVGGSRQTVSQLLADWRRTGMIDYTRTYICLEDPIRLQQCAQLSAS